MSLVNQIGDSTILIFGSTATEKKAWEYSFFDLLKSSIYKTAEDAGKFNNKMIAVMKLHTDFIGETITSDLEEMWMIYFEERHLNVRS